MSRIQQFILLNAFKTIFCWSNYFYFYFFYFLKKIQYYILSNSGFKVNIDCANLQYNQELKVVIDRSKAASKPHTNYSFLNLKQLENIVKKYADKLNDVNLEALNDKRKIFRLENKQSDYSRLLNLIG